MEMDGATTCTIFQTNIKHLSYLTHLCALTVPVQT